MLTDNSGGGNKDNGIAVMEGYSGKSDEFLTVEKLKWMLRKLPDDMPIFVEHVDSQEFMALEDQQLNLKEDLIANNPPHIKSTIHYRFLRGVGVSIVDNKCFITVYK